MQPRTTGAGSRVQPRTTGADSRAQPRTTGAGSRVQSKTTRAEAGARSSVRGGRGKRKMRKGKGEEKKNVIPQSELLNQSIATLFTRNSPK